MPRPPRLSGAVLLVFVLGACRTDSLTAPSESRPPACEVAPCMVPDAPAPDASIVIDPLEDAVARIVPFMLDARARADLPPALNALRADLLAGRLTSARVDLARAYDALDLAGQRLVGAGDAALVLDRADLSAIRLALVPASAALGVAVP